MKKIDFIIYYEHYKRELFGLLLLKSELEKRGYTVALSEFSSEHGKVDDYIKYFYNPEVVLYPWCYSNINVRQASFFYKKPPKIVNLQSEQLLSQRAFDTNFFNIREDALKAYHVCWGEESFKFFKRVGVDESKIIKSGNIALDINNKKFNDVFLTREELAKEFKLDNSKKWLLFVSNLKFPAMTAEMVESLENRSKGVRELNVYMSNARNNILEYFTKFLEENKDYQIIYRPHPVEPNSQILIELAGKYENFFYIQDYTIQQWINASERVLSYSSSSVVDAYYVNKPYATLRVEELPLYYDNELVFNCTVLKSYDEFYRFVSDDIYAKDVTDANKNDLKEIYDRWLYNDSSKLAYRALADSLIDILKKDEIIDYEWESPVTPSFRKKVFYHLLRLNDYVNLNYFNLNIPSLRTDDLKKHYINKKREKEFFRKIHKINKSI